MPQTLVFRATPKHLIPRPALHGPALHAIFLDWVRAIAPSLAAELHDHGANKPYTLSGLMHDGTGLVWRWSALNASTREVMLRLASSGPRSIQPGGLALSIDWEPTHPWANHIGYDELASAEFDRTVTWRLVTPTMFRQGGVNMPLPVPRLIIRSLIERWNALSGRPFPDGTLELLDIHVAITDAEIRTRVEKAGRMSIVGFLGDVTLGIDRHAQPDVLQAFATLSAFAPYCGLGAKTAQGFGQTVLATAPAASMTRATGPDVPMPPPVVPMPIDCD